MSSTGKLETLKDFYWVCVVVFYIFWCFDGIFSILFDFYDVVSSQFPVSHLILYWRYVVNNRDIFNALGKSVSSLPDMHGTGTAEEQEYEGEEDEDEGEDGPNSMDRAGFRVGNAGKKKGKKPRRGGAKKSTTVVNPKRWGLLMYF